MADAAVENDAIPVAESSANVASEIVEGETLGIDENDVVSTKVDASVIERVVDSIVSEQVDENEQALAEEVGPQSLLIVIEMSDPRKE